ncbi:Oidioi.mRNA.OKI2018_I69.PAR.g10801.t2.cds [Oikopleura dioica]|uniref:Oidioi.mRNA.OKI2018_I69.PAR.g10801.t2.cds n=1 Tax=Oikopleura dioica TaxID=34765 RepID=A0ABN7RVT1_OIKDI|nr:Oidioi.mRNA.OKI2018_I69.PAR.g10801.t2.cds [Oikopleura dioica]
MSISRGKYIVLGEANIVCTALRRDLQKANRWDSHDPQVDEDPQIQIFQELKLKLNQAQDLSEIQPLDYLVPFFEVIQSEDLLGPITGLALSTVNKFLSYGLIDPAHPQSSEVVERLAESVTRARFRGTVPANDEVVLMKIIQVLRTLVLTPIGQLLTNETVREIMVSCFRICFQMVFSELLRKTAEHTLVDVVQLLFSRLDNYKGRASMLGPEEALEEPVKTPVAESLEPPQESIEEESHDQLNETEEGDDNAIETAEEATEDPVVRDYNMSTAEVGMANPEDDPVIVESSALLEDETEESRPYGLPLVVDLFTFLASLIDQHERQNPDLMIKTGLSLIMVALEVARDDISEIPELLEIVQNDISKHLYQMLSCDKLSLVASSLRVSLLLFEALRPHLKYQLEEYLKRMLEIVKDTKNPNYSYELREVILDSLVQFFHLPGMATELYLNYDCDSHCSNLYEDTMKLLSKQAFTSGNIMLSTNLISLDGLCALVDSIEENCNSDSKTDGNTEKNTSPYNLDSGIMIAKKTFKKQSSNPPRSIRVSTRAPPRFSSNQPSVEEILIIKQKKKLFAAGTELFNQKPKKGIAFLEEQGLMGSKDWPAIAKWLRTNPALSKKEIGEFISGRHAGELLTAFLDTFDFTGQRIDEGLRSFLNTFRLPGEAPVIQRLLEAFARPWHEANGNCFHNDDSVVVLAYAVIMLNTDQHNANVAKNAEPMKVQNFKSNVRGCDGDKDFDQDMLEAIFNNIRDNEIVLAEEQKGSLKDDWIWSTIQQRSKLPEGIYIQVPKPQMYDSELFEITWGPTVHALGFAFDRSNDPSIIQRAVAGFRKCAKISAYYGKSDVFDNLIITLCKKTQLSTSAEALEIVSTSLGTNSKARLAARAVFTLSNRHGDIIREGWRNILDLLLPLFRSNLLPEDMAHGEDFVDGQILLVRDEAKVPQKEGGGVFSSFYSMFTGGAEGGAKSESDAALKLAREFVIELQPENIVTESKFLRLDSLHELVKTLIIASRSAETHESLGTHYSEESAVFYLEVLFRIVVQNRDRILSFWGQVRQHLVDIISSATEHTFLLERAVTGLLRLAIRLLHREDLQQPVLNSLQIILLVCPKIIPRLYRQIAYGLHELLQKCGADIHSSEDWFTIFLLLKTAGAGLLLESKKEKAEENQGEEEGAEQRSLNNSRAGSEADLSQASGMSDNESEGGNVSDRGYTSDNDAPAEATIRLESTEGQNEFSLAYHTEVGPHDPRALIRATESLAFLVRDTAHITPANFEICVDTIRAFVEASINGVNKNLTPSKKSSRSRRKRSTSEKTTESASTEDYQKVSMQLLELLQTLHTRAGRIFRSWNEDSIDINNLWEAGWCPLLEGIARMCCDIRRGIRTHAFNCLSSALLVQDLQVLDGTQWEACFHKVLFPLLTRLLENISPHDPNSMDETRMRAASLLSKVFLQHLKDLLTSPTFKACWLTILDFMDKYMRVGNRDLLCEAIPESLKNMLLVMDTAGIFHNPDTGYTDLWQVTWDRIDVFLPNLKQELFKETQQPEHLMPPAVPELERAPGMTHQNLLTMNQAADNMGTTIGIAANPLYAAAAPMLADQQPVVTSPIPAAASPVASPTPEVQQNPVEAKPIEVEPTVASPESPPVEPTPQESSSTPSLEENKSAPASGNLLFDQSVLQGIPKLESPILAPPVSESSSATPPLTGSDSLAAVIADLNKTLSQAPLPVTSSATHIPEFTGASSFFQSSAAEPGSVFDELEKGQPDLR